MRELPRGTSEVPARGGLSHTLLGVHCGPSYDSRSYPRELWWCTGCRTWSSWTRASPPAGSSVCSSACLQTPGVVKAFPGLLSPQMPLGEVLLFVWSWCLFSTQPSTLVACSWLSPHPQAWPSLLQLLQNPDSKPPLPLALCSPSCSSINCVKTLFIFTKTLFIFTKCPLFSDALQKQHIVFLSVIPGFAYHPSSPCS